MQKQIAKILKTMSDFETFNRLGHYFVGNNENNVHTAVLQRIDSSIMKAETEFGDILEEKF